MLWSTVQSEDGVDGFKQLSMDLRWLSAGELARQGLRSALRTIKTELIVDSSPILKAVAVGAAGLPSGPG
jgi:hypothetical protein